MGLKYEMEQRLILANAFGGTFVFFSNAQTNAKKIQKSHQANAPRHCKIWTYKQRQRERQHLTAVLQKSGFSG